MLLLSAMLNACGISATPASLPGAVGVADSATSLQQGFPQTLPVDRAQPWEQLDAQGG